MKYLMVHADINKAYFARMAYTSPFMTGVFNWPHVFNGDIINLDDYWKGDADVVHVNVCKATVNFPKMIKEHDKDVTVVSNLDYDIDMLSPYGGHKEFVQALNDSDFAFVNTLAQKDGLQHVVNKPLYFIPHPCDIGNIRNIRKRKEQREGLGVMAHSKYNQDENLAGLVARGLKIDTHLFHTIHPVDKDNFNFIWSPMEFQIFIKVLNNRLIAFDSHKDLALGRFQCECASLGIPCVGSSNVESQCTLFPKITTDHHSAYSQAVALIIKLLKDDDFYNEVVKHADEQINFYSFENCKKMFLEMIDK